MPYFKGLLTHWGAPRDNHKERTDLLCKTCLTQADTVAVTPSMQPSEHPDPSRPTTPACMSGEEHGNSQCWRVTAAAFKDLTKVLAKCHEYFCLQGVEDLEPFADDFLTHLDGVPAKGCGPLVDLMTADPVSWTGPNINLAPLFACALTNSRSMCTSTDTSYR